MSARKRMARSSHPATGPRCTSRRTAEASRPDRGADGAAMRSLRSSRANRPMATARTARPTSEAMTSAVLAPPLMASSAERHDGQPELDEVVPHARHDHGQRRLGHRDAPRALHRHRDPDTERAAAGHGVGDGRRREVGDRGLAQRAARAGRRSASASSWRCSRPPRRAASPARAASSPRWCPTRRRSRPPWGRRSRRSAPRRRATGPPAPTGNRSDGAHDDVPNEERRTWMAVSRIQASTAPASTRCTAPDHPVPSASWVPTAAQRAEHGETERHPPDRPPPLVAPAGQREQQHRHDQQDEGGDGRVAVDDLLDRLRGQRPVDLEHAGEDQQEPGQPEQGREGPRDRRRRSIAVRRRNPRASADRPKA